MKLYSLLLAVLFATPGLAAASDPFLGTWVYNAEKSPKPTITYGIKDLGDGRYALTGSSGETTVIKADGVAIKSPSGDTVSFKKLDDHTWQMDRTHSRTMRRTYTVSADDGTLTLVDVFTGANRGQETTTTVYARTSPGRSIYGEWKSTSMKEEGSGPADGLIIETYGDDGLRLTSTPDRRRTEMKFDGQQYPELHADGSKDGDASSGKRVSDRELQMESWHNGEPESHDEMKVSDDGKTLTVVVRPVKTAAVFTSVWEKQ